MDFIETIKNRIKGTNKRIVLPETMDERVLKATRQATDEGLAKIILIGKPQYDIDLTDIDIIYPDEDVLTNELSQKLYELRKDKGMTEDEAYHLLVTDYMYYACMLVKCGYADGVVSGACHSTSNTLRPALQIIKAQEKAHLVSAFFLVCVPDCDYGANGVFIFADAGLVQNPTAEELAFISGSSAETFKLLTNQEPIVAMLSHSTKGSAKHPDVDKVVSATMLAKQNYPQYQIDGELQLDAAIVPKVAKMKAPDSQVAGHANVLIFPDLDAGNIGYKLVERLAKAKAYGPITQGMAKPINDLSRGCNEDDIVGAIAITCMQASR